MKYQQYFAHDAYTRHDTKLAPMLSKWGAAGYGLYWMLMELLREQDEYRLGISGSHDFKTIARELRISEKKAREFVDELIGEFEILNSDGETIWSPELLAKMEKLEETREKRKKAADKRWVGDRPAARQTDAHAMHMHDGCNAYAMQEEKSKVKESKEEKSIVNQSRVEKNKLEESMPVVISEENNDVLASVWEAPRPDNAIFWWHMKQSITDGEARTLRQLMPGLSEHGLRDLLTRLYAVYVASGRSPMPYTEFVREHVNSLDQGRYSELIEECERS